MNGKIRSGEFHEYCTSNRIGFGENSGFELLVIVLSVSAWSKFRQATFNPQDCLCPASTGAAIIHLRKLISNLVRLF